MDIDDFDGFDDPDGAHAPEIGYTGGYCPDCDITMLFRSVSYPGGRTYKPLACTECGKELGGGTEEDAEFLGKMSGDAGDQIYELIPREYLEDHRLPEDDDEDQEPLSIEDCPSLVYDKYWVEAERKIGTYPVHTSKGGKWMLFVAEDNIDHTWVAVKKAVEDGQLGNRAKCSTALPNPNSNDPTKNVICVYTYDGDDEEDVWRVRTALRTMGFVRKIPWKSDDKTREGKYNNRGDKGVSRYYG